MDYLVGLNIKLYSLNLHFFLAYIFQMKCSINLDRIAYQCSFQA
jgi:hypothetical protein